MQLGERFHINKVFKVNLFTLCLHWTSLACTSPLNFDWAFAGAFAAMAEDRRLAGTVWQVVERRSFCFVLLAQAVQDRSLVFLSELLCHLFCLAMTKKDTNISFFY